MNDTVIKQDSANHTQPDAIGNLLLSALDMEDELAHSVYRDYLNIDNWPEGVKPEIFETISEHLNVLLKETEKHKNIVTHIKRKLQSND